MALMKPQININGTSRQNMVQDRRNVADKLMEAMKAMQETKPHGRDYVGNMDQYYIDRDTYAARFGKLDSLRNEILDEALTIQEGFQ